MSFYSKPWHSRIIIVFVAVKEKIPVVDVDGSYVYQKHKSLAESGRSIVVVSTKIAMQVRTTVYCSTDICQTKQRNGWQPG